MGIKPKTIMSIYINTLENLSNYTILCKYFVSEVIFQIGKYEEIKCKIITKLLQNIMIYVYKNSLEN